MSSSSWAVWLIIIIFLIVCAGIIIWFAIDNNIPGEIGTDQGKITIKTPCPSSCIL